MKVHIQQCRMSRPRGVEENLEELLSAIELAGDRQPPLKVIKNKHSRIEIPSFTCLNGAEDLLLVAMTKLGKEWIDVVEVKKMVSPLDKPPEQPAQPPRFAAGRLRRRMINGVLV